MTFLNSPKFLLTLLSLSASSLACGPVGPHRGSSRHARRSTATTTSVAASSSADNTNPTSECAYYDFPVVDAITPNYPAIWVNAEIVSNDTEALNAFKALEPHIPNIAVKGTPHGDFSVSSNYSDSDPDCWWTYSTCTTPKIATVQPDVVECLEQDVYGLTFDDGPNCSHNAFYDYLLEQKQKASMFFIGSNVIDWPLEAQRALTDGHEICVHTWSHPYMTGMSNEGVFAELWYTKKIIKEIVGVTPQCWRPPFGDVDDRVRFIAEALDLKTIIWIDDTDDWDYTVVGVDAINANYQAIIDKSNNGSFSGNFGPIVLAHELDNETMTLAMEWLPKISAAFKHVTPVNVCRNNTRPYVEQDVVYPNFAQYIAGTVTISGNPTPTAIASASIAMPYTSGHSVPTDLPYDIATAGSISSIVSNATSSSGSASQSVSSNASASSSSSLTSSSATALAKSQDTKTSGAGKGFLGSLVGATVGIAIGVAMI